MQIEKEFDKIKEIVENKISLSEDKKTLLFNTSLFQKKVIFSPIMFVIYLAIMIILSIPIYIYFDITVNIGSLLVTLLCYIPLMALIYAKYSKSFVEYSIKNKQFAYTQLMTYNNWIKKRTENFSISDIQSVLIREMVNPDSTGFGGYRAYIGVKLKDKREIYLINIFLDTKLFKLGRGLKKVPLKNTLEILEFICKLFDKKFILSNDGYDPSIEGEAEFKEFYKEYIKSKWFLEIQE